MKTILKTGFALIIAVSATVYSCRKYEDGPKISFSSKKSRIAGTWKVDKYLLDGVDKTSDYRLAIASESFVVAKDGKYTYSQSNTTLLGGQTSTDAGKWEFIDKKEEFRSLSDTSGAVWDTTKITRLTQKEFWVKSVSKSQAIEIHFIP